MPTVFAASIKSVFGGTCTARPSIVRLTKSAIQVLNTGRPGGLPYHQRVLVYFVRTRLAVQVIFELLAPFFHDRNGRQGSGVTERAERAAQHVLGDIPDQV